MSDTNDGGTMSTAATGSDGSSSEGGTSESGETSTGGDEEGDCVEWLDPLGYAKPACYPIPLPEEADVRDKYWVDMSSGSGTTCSQAEPCAALIDVAGKPGTDGGPAYVCLKGEGRLELIDVALAGAPGSEIVVKPWPNDPTPAVMSATDGCSVPDANVIAGAGVHDLVLDGGAAMLLRFVGSGCTSDQNGYTLAIASDAITLYRVRIDANDSAGPALGVATGIGGTVALSGFRMINSELYGATRYYGVYTGGGTGCEDGDTSHTNLEFRNSVFRDIDGRGIQIEPRADSSGVVIDGNAFHRIGYNDSATSSISGAVQVANACHGTTRGVVVSNNLMWDLGGGGVLVYVDVDEDASFHVVNNTIWDYGNQTPVELGSHAITCYDDGCNADVRNNVVLDPANEGINPLNRSSGFATADNLCEGGSECGADASTGTASDALASIDPDAASFLFPAGAALDGAAFLPEAALDYLGASRDDPTDIGGIEQ